MTVMPSWKRSDIRRELGGVLDRLELLDDVLQDILEYHHGTKTPQYDAVEAEWDTLEARADAMRQELDWDRMVSSN
jgi:hypothetical protein